MVMLTLALNDLALAGAGPILLVCGDADRSAAILARLHDLGLDAVGPVATAAVALAMAAVKAPALAIVAGRPAGRRDAAELAKRLQADWGVRALLLDGAALDPARI